MSKRVHTRCHNLRSSSPKAHDNGPSRRHRLHDDKAKRLQAGAGVDDDVERTKSRFWRRDETGEPDSIANTKSVDYRHQLGPRVLTSFGLVHRIANDVGTNGHMPRYARDGVEKGDVALPSRKCPDQSDSNDGQRGRLQARERIEIQTVARWRKSPHVDGVVDWNYLYVRKRDPRILCDTVRICQDD